MSKIAKATDPSVRIRFPRKVLRDLDQAAAQAGRSRNSEIIYRLTQTFRAGVNEAPPAPQAG